jgi:AraC-like DNA-binding protein
MDDQLRSDLLPAAAGALIPQVAALRLRQCEPPVTPESHREALGPALFSTTLVAVGRWRCPVDSVVFADSGPARWHLFVFPRSSVWIAHEDQPPFVADPTVVTFYNRGQRYRRAPLSPSGDRGDWFAVAPGVLADVLAPHDPGVSDRGPRLFPFSHGPSDLRSYGAQRAVFEHVSREAAPDALFVEETVLEVLDRVAGLAYARALPQGARTHGSTRGLELVEHARAVLARRFAEDVSLHELAREVGSSPYHLARVFRRATGDSLHGYRTELRLRLSLERLAEPASDLLELALALGYSSHSHFTGVFRAAFGVTPSEVRGRLSAGRGRELVERLAPRRACPNHQPA